MKTQLKGTALLLLAAMIWGAAFTAQTVGMDYVGPFTFQSVRQLLGCLVLLPVIALRDRTGASRDTRPKTKKDRLYLLFCGALCGTVLFCACSLQQIGLLTTSAGKSGFLTALYIILVPLVGLFLGKKLHLHILFAAVIALIGLYFLCLTDGLSVARGEILTIGCAVCFTAHILILDRVSGRVDGVRLSCLQFLFCGLLSVPFMLLTETVAAADILACWLPICYTGLLSCGVAYTLQIIAQKDTDPTLASIAMSMEAVFSALFGWLILGQRLSARELLGCGLMFAAVILAQLPEKKKI